MAEDLTQGASLDLGLCMMRIAAPLLSVVLVAVDLTAQVVALAMVDVDLVDPMVHLAVLVMTVLLDSA